MIIRTPTRNQFSKQSSGIKHKALEKSEERSTKSAAARKNSIWDVFMMNPQIKKKKGFKKSRYGTQSTKETKKANFSDISSFFVDRMDTCANKSDLSLKSGRKQRLRPRLPKSKNNQNIQSFTNDILNDFVRQRLEALHQKTQQNDKLQKRLQNWETCLSNLNRRKQMAKQTRRQLDHHWRTMCQLAQQYRSPISYSIQEQANAFQQRRSQFSEVSYMWPS